MLWGPVSGFGRDIAVDRQGNVFGSGGIGTYTISKFYGQTGQQLWINFIGSASGSGTKMVVDPLGNVCITGSTGGNEPSLVIKICGQTGQIFWFPARLAIFGR